MKVQCRFYGGICDGAEGPMDFSTWDIDRPPQILFIFRDKSAPSGFKASRLELGGHCYILAGISVNGFAVYRSEDLNDEHAIPAKVFEVRSV